MGIFAATLSLQAQTSYTQGLSVWFDQPTTLKGRAVWYGGRPDLWKGKGKPEWGAPTEDVFIIKLGKRV